MLALSDTAGVILLVLGVVFVVAAGVALVLRSRVTREPAPDIPPAMEPGPSDPCWGEPKGLGRIAIVMNCGLLFLVAVVAGMGIFELATVMAPDYPELVRIWPGRSEPYDLWLVMHGDLNRTARVRAVADAIVEVFEADK